MSTELISVIIPVYNVEDYLNACVDTCIAQTYSNIEILLINDGSTDSSQNICQEYEKKDSRVKLFNKENGGLSDARNYGMTKMQGQYFTFVDSDDILPENFLEELYRAIKTYDTKLSMCDFVRMVDDRVEAGNLQIRGLCSSTEVVRNCFKGVLAHSACAKLFDASLKEEIEFPVGRYYEDEFSIYDVLLKHDAAVTNDTKYIYRKRPGSITQNDKVEKRNQDLYDALEHVEKAVKNERPELAYALDFKILQDCMVIIKNDIKAGRNSDLSKKSAGKIKILSKENLERMGTGRSFMAQYKMISTCFPIYRFIFLMMYTLHLNTEA